MKKKVINIIFVICILFFCGCLTVNANNASLKRAKKPAKNDHILAPEIKKCNTSQSHRLCAYGTSQNKSVLKITACYGKNDGAPFEYYFYMTTATTDEQKGSFYTSTAERAKEKDNFEGSGLIKTVYMTNDTFNKIKKVSSTKPKYGSQSSADCPNYIALTSDLKEICIGDNKSFCDNKINTGLVFDQKLATDTGDSEKIKKTQGDEEYFKKKYETYDKAQVELGTATCDSVLGLVSDKTTPAYYLNYAFSIMKYIAIIILVIFTALDYLKAVVGKDDDMLTKANNKFIGRLVTCIIIFFAPILINVLLSWANIIDTSASCSIGGL